MKSLLSALLFLALTSCAKQLTISSLASLPPIPEGSARIVHIFEDSPMLWRAVPIFIHVDGRPVEKIVSARISHHDVPVGRHLISYELARVLGVDDGLSLSFLPQQTRYLYVKTRRSSSGVLDWMETSLDIGEISAQEANRLIAAMP